MESKILLIVGASSDFGCEYIKRYHGEYDVIIAHYNTSKENLEALQCEIEESEFDEKGLEGKRIEGLERKLKLIQANLLDDESLQNLFSTIRDMDLVPTHIIHLPASKVEYVKLAKSSWEDIQRAVDLQARSAYYIAKEFVPAMAKKKTGQIVFMLTSNTCDNYPPKYMLPYTTSKYMLLGLMKSLAVDYVDKGITVNAVSPSMTETKFIENVPRLLMEMTEADHPMKRLARVDDIVPMIHFLLSDDAKYITGQNILISGGV